MNRYLDFENDIANIESLINKLNLNSSNYKFEKNKLVDQKKKIIKKIYSNLSSWEKVQVARHANRPHAKDYINMIFDDVIYLHGDKKYADDPAILGCLGKISDQSVMIIGTEKGNSMESRIQHNFGMAKPEGYRKAQRLMTIADKFNLPVVTFVDTAGAFPGKDAEERGQSESIASSIQTSLKIGSPIISIIIGEGGSGGAIALATADIVLMLEHSIYSVISPEGCSSILWRSNNFTKKAAESLKLTAQDCLKNKIIDSIVEEVDGGAHRYSEDQASILKNQIINSINNLNTLSVETRRKKRNEKFLNMTSDI
ncbi:MAG: acetyl-CoA carboxylase carboxyltransferase subunit alpha [Alphaproteobacteria bacterium]